MTDNDRLTPYLQSLFDSTMELKGEYIYPVLFPVRQVRHLLAPTQLVLWVEADGSLCPASATLAKKKKRPQDVRTLLLLPTPPKNQGWQPLLQQLVQEALTTPRTELVLPFHQAWCQLANCTSTTDAVIGFVEALADVLEAETGASFPLWEKITLIIPAEFAENR